MTYSSPAASTALRRVSEVVLSKVEQSGPPQALPGMPINPEDPHHADGAPFPPCHLRDER